MPPSTMKAVVMTGPGEVKVVSDRPVPQLRPGYILVKVEKIAFNPTDFKHVDNLPTPGAVIGCDFAGTVEQTGTGYRKSWKVGDRVFGFAHGANSLQKEDGAFAEYVVARADIAMRIPEGMDFGHAATMALGIFTVGQGLYQALGLPLPGEDSASSQREEILIYGGSTATGTLGIQFAKLSGFKVITTCRPSNFDLVKSLGADKVFDYTQSDCAAKIRKYTNNSLKYAWDTISLEDSTKFCEDALTDGPGAKYAALLPPKPTRKDVDVKSTLMYTVAGEPIEKRGAKIPVKEEDVQFAGNFAALSEKLLAAGKLKPHPSQLLEGGFEAVPKALDMLRTNAVSGKKIVA